MIIKESQLREIIKDELLNEFFGRFKRKPEPKKMFLPQKTLDRINKGSKAKQSYNPQLKKFFKKLESAKLKIQKFQSILLKLERGQSLGFDTMSAESEVLSAAEGLNLFEEKVFPLIDKLAKSLKENKQNNTDQISIIMNEEMLILGSIFESEFLDIDSFLNISDKDLLIYMSSLSKEDKKQKEALIQFFVSIFRFIVKHKDKVDSIIEKKLRQIQDASQKLGGKRNKTSRNTTSRNALVPSIIPNYDSEGYKKISMDQRPEGSTDL